MVAPAAPANRRSSVHTAASVDDFLNYLLPSAQHWKAATRGDLGYRGQAQSRWRLVPKAFRPTETLGYGVGARKAAPTQVVAQARAEFQALQQFVRAADACALTITDTGGRLLLHEDPRDIFNDTDWEYRWPQSEILETLGLAQHHGVPTRLVDFTEDPLVAAFFAGLFAWDSIKAGLLNTDRHIYLSVWVVDLRFVRSVGRTRGRYVEPIGEIRVPRGNNEYLSAQSAYFLMDRGANDLMASGALSTLEKAIVDRAHYWHTRGRLERVRLRQTWFAEAPVRSVRLHARHARALLRELEDRGTSLGTVMPSLDRVVESLTLRRELARRV